MKTQQNSSYFKYGAVDKERAPIHLKGLINKETKRERKKIVKAKEERNEKKGGGGEREFIVNKR